VRRWFNSALGHQILWVYSGHMGNVLCRLSVTPVLASNQFDAALDACVRGIGVGQFFCFQVQRLLDGGQLKLVLREFEPPLLPIHLIFPNPRLLSANVRAFVNWTVPRLQSRMQAATP
jgi:DNA-binding transcriptional LysR family regulator